jgi:hypothetical protein
VSLADEEPLTHKQKQENRIVERVIARLKDSLAPKSESGGVRPEELTKFVRFMESARILAASALLAAMLGAIYENLALMGVTDVSPARAVLICAWFFGVMFSWELLTLTPWSRKLKGWVLGASVIFFLLMFVGLDRWTIWWKTNHPPEIARFTEAVQGMQSSIQQFTKKTSPLQIEQSVLKDILPVPGYLKMDFGYPHGLPLEQPNKGGELNVVFGNKGSTYTHDSTMKGALFYVDFHGVVPPPTHDEQMERGLKDQVAKIPSPAYGDIAPGAGIWSTYYTTVLSQDMYDAIEAGTARIYLIVYAEWTTNKIPDHVSVCSWLQPVSWSRADALPASFDPTDPIKGQPVWHAC